MLSILSSSRVSEKLFVFHYLSQSSRHTPKDCQHAFRHPIQHDLAAAQLRIKELLPRVRLANVWLLEPGEPWIGQIPSDHQGGMEIHDGSIVGDPPPPRPLHCLQENRIPAYVAIMYLA